MSKVERNEMVEDARDWTVLTGRVFACCSWCKHYSDTHCTLDNQINNWCEQACACFAN